MKMNISDMMDSYRDDTVPIQITDAASTRRIKEAAIQKVQGSNARPQPSYAWRFARSLTAACLTILLLALPVSAEMQNGYISNLLAPLYGMHQTELVDSIGIPVGASTTVGDYTLTADAVIGDRYNTTVVYTLSRTDNGQISNWLHFRNWSPPSCRSSSGASLTYKRSEDKRKMHIISSMTSTSRRFRNRKIEETFSDLVLEGPNGEKPEPVAEGEWSLSFTARFEDTTKKLPVRNLEVEGENGEQFVIHKLYLSPISLQMDLTAPSPFQDGKVPNELLPGFSVSLVLTDGTEVDLSDRHCGGATASNDTILKTNWNAMFEFPIPMDTIQAINICGTLVEVNP